MEGILAQGMFLSSLFLMGLAFWQIFNDSLDFVSIVVLSFPAGAALWVVFSIVIINTGIHYTAVSITGLCLVFFLAVGIYLYLEKRPPERKSILAVLFFVMSLGLALAYNYTFLIYGDCYNYLLAGKVLAQTGWLHPPAELTPYMTRNEYPMALGYGMFIPLVEGAAGSFYNFDYTSAFIPLNIFWFLLGFGWLLYKTLINFISKYWAVSLGFLSVLILSSSYLFFIHTFVVMSNATAMVYFSLATIGLWLYAIEKKKAWLALTTLSLIAFSLSRVEGPVFAILILIPLIQVSLNKKSYEVFTSVTIYLLVIFTWYLKLLITYYDYEKYVITLTVPKLLFILATLFSLYLLMIYSSHPKLKEIWNNSKRLLLYAMAVLAAAMTFFMPVRARISFNAFAGNTLYAGYWGATWILIIFLSGISLFFKSLEDESIFITIIGCYLLLIFSLMMLNPTVGVGDTHSSNRTLLHIFPTIIFYLFLKYANNFPGSLNNSGIITG